MRVVRRYVPEDLQQVIHVFLLAIRQTASADYAPQQIAAWGQVDQQAWSRRCASRPTWVAVSDGTVVGFTELEADGHLDMMYVHPQHSGRGIATQLLQTAKHHAVDRGITRLYAEVSITARPFFTSQGFTVVEPERVLRNGEYFVRYKMEMLLPACGTPTTGGDEAPVALCDRVRIEDEQVLADDWSVLKKTTLSYLRNDGSWQRQTRETYDRGDGATILLYDPTRRTVLLTRQFRYPAFVNGHEDLLIETPAGRLDDANPETRIRAELEEETGYRVGEVRQVFDVFMSPGSVTERVHCFVGVYSAEDRIAEGGGNLDEGEDIERLEPTIDDALRMVADGRIRDAKTIMLLQFAALHLFSR